VVAVGIRENPRSAIEPIVGRALVVADLVGEAQIRDCTVVIDHGEAGRFAGRGQIRQHHAHSAKIGGDRKKGYQIGTVLISQLVDLIDPAVAFAL
jgi:hypothetical protein